MFIKIQLEILGLIWEGWNSTSHRRRTVETMYLLVAGIVAAIKCNNWQFIEFDVKGALHITNCECNYV